MLGIRGGSRNWGVVGLPAGELVGMRYWDVALMTLRRELWMSVRHRRVSMREGERDERGFTGVSQGKER